MVIDLLEWRLGMQQYIGTALTGVATLILDHPDVTFFGTVGILGSLAAWGVRRHWKNRKVGETYMAARKACLDQLYADGLHSMMIGLLHCGKISDQEYRRDLQKMAKDTGLSDLKRRSYHPEATRHRVKTNIKTVKLVDASGQPIQPRIPGPKPGEAVPVPPRKQSKSWIAKGKSLLHRVA